jgi:hypothetical protein
MVNCIPGLYAMAVAASPIADGELADIEDDEEL